MKKLNKKRLTLFAFLILVSIAANAQDANFSQFWNSPFLTNPGMISVKPDAVIAANYRSQWKGIGTPFTTFMLGGYYPILSKDKYRHFGSAGAFILSDNKPGASFRNTGFGINGSYKLPLNFANFMHFGIQFSYYQMKMGLTGVSTGSQWNGSNFDPNASINEDPTRTKGVPAVSLGTQWVNEDVSGDIRYQAGLAVFNLNRPNLALYRGGINDNLNFRYVFTGGIRAVKVNNIVVFPSVRAQIQGPGTMLQAGTSVRYGINDGPNKGDGIIKNGSVGIGAWYQIGQAVIAMVEFNQPNYSISMNYDFGMSGYKTDQANSNAAEFFIMYKKTLGRRKKIDLRYYRTRESLNSDSGGGNSGGPSFNPSSTPAKIPAPKPNITPSISPTPPPASVAPASTPVLAPASPAVKPIGTTKPAASTAKPGAKKVTQKTTTTKKTTSVKGAATSKPGASSGVKTGAKPAIKANPSTAKPKAGPTKKPSSTKSKPKN